MDTEKKILREIKLLRKELELFNKYRSSLVTKKDLEDILKSQYKFNQEVIRNISKKLSKIK